MEIYRNEVREIELSIPNTASSVLSVTGKYKDNQEVAVPFTFDNELLTVSLPFSLVRYDGPLTFETTFELDGEEYSSKESVDVVTPLFNRSDFEGEEYNNVDVEELESLVRHVIEAYTGTSFGVSKESYTSNDLTFHFNQPILMLNEISDGYLRYSTTLNPYVMHKDNFGMTLSNYDIKTDTHYQLRNRRMNDSCITVRGEFGYFSVPSAVKEAALLIAGVWGCNQAIWRDRYVKVLRTANMSVGYEKTSETTTGSLAADNLLNKYVVLYRAAII